MVAAQASWKVVCGVIPGEAIAERSRFWWYTAEDSAKDQANAGDGYAETLFTAKMKAAHDYALSLTDPRVINWVRVEFLWY